MDYIRGKKKDKGKDKNYQSREGSPLYHKDEEGTGDGTFDASDPEFYSNMSMDEEQLGDAVDRSGQLFSQLDTMIRTVQEESNALDSMRNKLKELDAMKQHISALTKRLLSADQSILNLKTSLVKMQEAYTKMKESKQDLEGQLAPVRVDLVKIQQAFKAENVARLSAQQENTMLKERMGQLEDELHNLRRENKQIPSLQESLDIVKSDLSQLRQKYKGDRKQMENTLRRMEDHSRGLEMNRGETRKLAMELLDITDGEIFKKKRAQQAGVVYNSPGPGSYASPHQAQQQNQSPQMQGSGSKHAGDPNPLLTYY